MQKILVLAYTTSHVASMLPSIRRLKKDEIIIVTPSIDISTRTKVWLASKRVNLDEFGASRALSKLHIPHKTSNEYSYDIIYGDLDEQANFFANNWFKNKFLKTVVNYRGISLSELVTLDFYFFFMDLLKSIDIVKGIVKKEKPSKIIIANDENPIFRTAIVVGKAMGIPVSTVDYKAKLKGPGIVDKDDMVLSIRRFTIRLKSLFNRFSLDRKRKVLMVNIYPDIIKPLMHELKQKRDITVTPLNISHPRRIESIYYTDLGAYVNNEINSLVKKEAMRLKNEWGSLRNNTDFQKIFTYEGMIFWDVIKEKLSDTFQNLFVELTRYIETLGYFIKKENPAIVLVMEDKSPIMKTVVTSANSMRIPTLVIQHGVTGGEIGYVPLIANRIAVWGDMSREWLIKRGVDPKKINVTGNPRYDKLVDNRGVFEKNRIHRKFNSKLDKKTLLFTTQSYEGIRAKSSYSAHESLTYELFKSMKHLPEYQLVVKVHPSESRGEYERLLKETGGDNIVITKKADTFGLINACDILITLASTTALEAMILDKPVIVMRLIDKLDPIGYVKSGSAVGVYRADDIISAIKNVLYDKEVRDKMREARKKFVQDYACKQDAKASKRVAELIYNMVNK